MSLTEAMNKQLLQTLNDTMEPAWQALVANEVKPRIPEAVFVQQFLPYFTGQPVEPGRRVLEEWVAFTGSPTMEADVVDAAGKVLYTVPSMYNTNVLKLANDRGQAMSHILAEHRLMQGAGPYASMNYLDRASDAKVKAATDKEKSTSIYTTNEQRWVDIAARYNANTKSADGKSAAKNDDNGSDDLVY